MYTAATTSLLQAQQIALREWRDIVSMYEEQEIDLENAALITASWCVAYRLSIKALKMVQLEEAERLNAMMPSA